MLTRDQILGATDLPTDTIDVPAWGGQITVRACPVGSVDYTNYVNAPLRDERGKLLRDDLNQPLRPSADEVNKRRLVAAVIKSVIDADGNPVFTWKDATALREKHWNTVSAVALAAFSLAARDEDDDEDDAPPAGSVAEGKDA